jgi:hypothetical protein
MLPRVTREALGQEPRRLLAIPEAHGVDSLLFVASSSNAAASGRLLARVLH